MIGRDNIETEMNDRMAAINDRYSKRPRRLRRPISTPGKPFHPRGAFVYQWEDLKKEIVRSPGDGWHNPIIRSGPGGEQL
jgi:hypothetical protein